MKRHGVLMVAEARQRAARVSVDVGAPTDAPAFGATHARFSAHERRAAEQAAHGLARARPWFSAAFGPSWSQWALMAALPAAAVWGFVAAPDLAATVVRGLITAGVAALALFRLAALATPKAPARARGWTGPAPVYTVIAPLAREANVVADLVQSLSRLDHPRDKLDIKLVIEADDAETLAAARALDLAPTFEILLVPPGAPRTKPRALNHALAFAKGEFVVIYDAEDRPHPRQIRAALDAFAAGGPRLACVQAPLEWWNAAECWITRQLALEYAAQFHVILPALARWGWALPLGGTSNHFRRAALAACGGWDPYNVTEDADLGFRLARDGWRTGMIAPPTQEEATTTFPAWTSQRTRWLKGFMVTWGVHTRRPLRLLRPRQLKAAAPLALTIGLAAVSAFIHGPLALAAATALAVHAVAGAPLPVGPVEIATLLLGYGAAAAAALVGLRRAGRRDLALDVFAMPLYWPLQTIAAARAVAQLATRPHHWEKTAHGATRMTPPAARDAEA